VDLTLTTTLVVSPDGKVLAMLKLSDRNRTVGLWDAATGKARGQLRHEATVHGLTFSPDGKRCLTYAADNPAQLWDATNGNPIGGPFTHRSGVSTAAFAPDGATVLAACGDGTVRLWSPPGGQPLDTSFLHKGVNAVAFSPDGRTFLTASSTG